MKWKHSRLLLAAVVASGFLYWLGGRSQDRDFLAQHVARTVLRTVDSAIEAGRPVYFVPDWENERGKKIFEEAFYRTLSQRWLVNRWETGQFNAHNAAPLPTESYLRIRFSSRGHLLVVHLLGASPTQEKGLWLDREFEFFYPTWITLLPLVLGALVTLWRRHVISGIGVALLLGACIREEFDLFSSLSFLFQAAWGHFRTSGSQLWMLLIAWNLLWMVQLARTTGAFDRWSRRWVGKTGSEGRLFASTLLVCAVFFSDPFLARAASSLALRGAFDRARLSRALLAFWSSTASSVFVSLSVIFTWALLDESLVSTLLRDAKVGMDSRAWMLGVLPYRFFSWMLLLFLILGWAMRKQFQSRWWQPQEAIEEGQGAEFSSVQVMQTTGEAAGRQTKSDLAFALPWLFFVTASALVISWPHIARLFSWDSVRFITRFQPLEVLAATSTVSALLCWGLCRLSRWSAPHLLQATSRAAHAIRLPAGILLAGWMLQDMVYELQVSSYVLSLFPSDLNSRWLPSLLFIVSSLLTGAVGWGWVVAGTLLPMAIPLSFKLGGVDLLLLSSAAVMEGAVLGELLSPASPKAVLVSLCSGCRLWVHLRTMLIPLAWVSSCAVVFGFFLVPHDMPLVLAYILGGLSLAFSLSLLGETQEKITADEMVAPL